MKEYKEYEAGVSGERHGFEESDILTLTEDMTIWLWLQVLSLEPDSGCVSRVPVFFNSMEPSEFRTLYATCEWIASHGKNEHYPMN